MRLIAAASLSFVLAAGAARADDAGPLPPLPAPSPSSAPPPPPPPFDPAAPPAGVTIIAAPAPAAHEPVRPARRTWLTAPGPDLSIDGTLGFGTPVGWLGVGLTVHPLNRFAASAGVGIGTRGYQVAGMLHAYPIDLGKWSRVGFGAGVSTGTYATSHFSNGGFDLNWDRYWERAWFLNLEASIAAWDAGGLGIEPFVGYGIVLNDSAGACSTWRSSCSHFTGLVFFGLKGHFGFDL